MGGERGIGERACPSIAPAAASKTNARVGLAVVSLAPEKRLFLNVRRKRLLVSLFGKKLCDINERLNPF